MVRLLHTFDSTELELLDKAREKRFGNPNPPCYSERYKGAEKSKLYRAITKEKVYAATRSTTKNTAPRADRIINTLIHNPGDEAIQELTKFINTLGGGDRSDRMETRRGCARPQARKEAPGRES